MRCIALAVLSSFAVGCAHFTQPPPPAMVEVTDGSIASGPPAAPGERRDRRPMSRRRALLLTGGIIAGIGSVLTIAGAAAYAAGKRQQAESAAYCAARPDLLFCGIGDAFDTVPGSALMGTGIPHVAAGLVTIFFGVDHHD